VTFTVTQPTGGLANPSVDAALAKMGNVWETLGLNALGIDDDAALDAIQAHGDGRWLPTVRKPFVSFVGNTASTVAAATSVTSDRQDDRVNAQLVAPGSNDLPFVVAARQLARIASVANNNPPTGYAGQKADRLTPGADDVQWTWTQRDQAIKAGSSTVEVVNGVIEPSQVITFYRPDGDPTPAYRFVRDIVKLQNIIFNMSLIFEAAEWKGAPLIPDDQPTVNPNARKPRSAVAEVTAMHDSLGLNAIISDPEFAKENTFANISAQNPNRLDLSTTVKLSGNTDIISATLNFGFFFGEAQVAA
jgi:phage tail sheath gpL-like